MVTRAEFDAKLTALTTAIKAILVKLGAHPAAADFAAEAAQVQDALDSIAAADAPPATDPAQTA